MGTYVTDSEWGTKYPHFRKSEFKCKCGKCNGYGNGIATSLVQKLELLRDYIEASSINIYSGYRCVSHDKAVGGSGKGPHTIGYAVDMYAYDKNKKLISSKEIAMALEDLSHITGIGYRCGGSSPETGRTHIDTKNRKWYGDESKSMSLICCTSFYSYLGVDRTKRYIKQLQHALNKQFNCNLEENGLFDVKTQNECSKYNIKKQNNDDTILVKWIQVKLNYWGYKVYIDGHFGKDCETKVKEFQKNNGLIIDGIVGRNTYKKLCGLK